MRYLLFILLIVSVCFGRNKTSGDSLFYRIVKSDTAYIAVEKSNIKFLDSVTIGKSSNNVKIDTTAGIVLNGNTTCFNDIEQFYLFAAKNIGQTGAPPLTASGKGFSFPAFGINDSLEGQIEYNHQYVDPGDTLHFHLHYETNGKEGSAKYVKWSVHYKILNINDTLTYENTLTYQDTIPANTPTLQHRIIEIGEVAVPNLHIGGYIFVMLKRIAANPATNPVANPFGITLGVHAKVNTMGSRTETTK